MSYLCDAIGEKLQGQFASTYSYPITLGIWVKASDWDASNRYALQLGNITNNWDDSLSIRNAGTADSMAASHISTAGGVSSAERAFDSPAQYDDVWLPVIATFLSDTERNVFYGNISQTVQSVVSQTVTETLDHICVGNSLETGNDEFVDGLIAEAAIWNKELTPEEITNYLVGTQAKTIASANLIGYWPLSLDNSTQLNQGSDTGGDLTVTNATFTADHPTIVTPIQVVATEDFSVANDPLTTSSDWSQCGATTAQGSGKASGGLLLDGNTVDSNDRSAYWASDPFTDDQYGQIKFVDDSDLDFPRIGIILRGDAGNEAIMVRYLPATGDQKFECYYWNSSGTRIQIGTSYTSSETFKDGDTMRARIVGTIVTLSCDFGAGFVDETAWDASASGITSGSVGCYIVGKFDATTRADDWEGGNVGPSLINAYPLGHSPRSGQPSEDIPLDLSHPLLEGVFCGYSAHSGVELVRGGRADLRGTGAVIAGTEMGQVLDTDGTNGVVDLNIDESLITHIDDPYTIIWFGRTVDDAGTLLSTRDGALRNFQFLNNGIDILALGTGDTIVPFSGDTRVQDGEWRIYGVTHEGASSNIRGWIDGDNFDTIARPVDVETNLINMSVNARWEIYPTVGFPIDGECLYALTWQRELSAAEMISLAEDPWQIFEAQQEPLLIAVDPLPTMLFPVTRADQYTESLRVSADGFAKSRDARTGGSQNFSMSVWCKVITPRVGTNRYVLNKDDGGGLSEWFGIGWGSDEIYEMGFWSNAGGEGSAYTNFSASPTDGEWFFTSLTFDGTDLDGYWYDLDGTSHTVTDATSGPDPVGTAWWGSNSFNDWVDCVLADGAIWNRKLTARDVQDVYEHGPQAVQSGLVAHYDFDGNLVDQASGLDLLPGLTAYVQTDVELFRPSSSNIYMPAPESIPITGSIAITLDDDTSTATGATTSLVSTYPLRSVLWTEQPPQGTRLDWSNPLTDGLLWAKSFGDMLAPDDTDKASPTVVDFTQGSGDIGRYGGGQYLEATGISGDYFDSGYAPPVVPGADYTVMVLMRTTDTGNVSLMSCKDSVDGVPWIWLLLNAGEVYIQSGAGGGDSLQWDGAPYNTAIDGDWHLLSITSTFPDNPTITGTGHLYVDGVEDSRTDVQTVTPTGTPVNIAVGHSWSTKPGTVDEGDIDFAFAGVWDRKLSADEQQSIAENLWQIFEPRVEPLLIESSPPAAATGVSPYPLSPMTRTTAPMTPVGFDPNNILGQHCLFAVVPGWGEYGGTGSGIGGSVRSVGQEFEFLAEHSAVAGGTDPTLEKTFRDVAHLGGVEVSRHWGDSRVNHSRFRENAPANFGIDFPDSQSLCIVGFVIPDGTGVPASSSDPRLFLKDSSASSADIDFMIGWEDVTFKARTRFRLNITTTTTRIDSGTVQSDALNMIAGYVTTDLATGDAVPGVVHFREDGVINTGTGTSDTSGYNPKNTTEMGWGGVVGAGDNAMKGDVIVLFAFDFDLNASADLGLLRQLWENPWQVFAPESTAPMLIGEDLGITGTVNETLEDTVSTISGELEAEGTLTETLDNSTSVGSGEIFIQASLAETLDDAISTTAGELEAEGTLAETLGDTTSVGTGELEAESSLAETLDDATSTTAGELEVEGTLAQTLGDATSTTVGELEAEGTLTETLSDATSVASGEVGFIGTLAETLGDATSVGSGEIFFEGSLAETLDGTTVVASGSIGFEGSLSEILDDVTVSSDGEIFFEASLTQTLDDTTSATSGELEVESSLAETLDDAIGVAEGSTGFEGSLAETLDNDTVIASGEIEVQGSLAETLDLSTSAVSGEIFFLASLDETLGNSTSTTAGELEAEGTVAETLENTSLSATGIIGDLINGTIEETLDNDTVVASGLRHHIGNVTETLDDVISTTSGELENEGTLAETLDLSTSVISGDILFEGSLAETLDDTANVITGELFIPSFLAEVLDDVSNSVIGELEVESTLTEILSNDTGLATGFIGQDATGTISTTLEDIVPTISGSLEIESLLDLTLEDSISTVTAEGIITGTVSEVLDTIIGLAEGGLPVSGSLNTVLDFTLINMSGLVIATEKIHGGFDAERQSIETRFNSNWSVTPIRWPNVKFSSSGLTEYVIFNNITEQADQMDMGVVKPSYRYNGEVNIRICVKPNTGTKRVLQLANLVSDIWRNAAWDGITFESVRVNTVGIVDGWYEIEVISPYYRSSYELRSVQ